MSTAGTWCDNIIIQAVANSLKCVIHITESDVNKPEGTVIYPLETVCHNSSKLADLKTKLSGSSHDRETRLSKKTKSKSSETHKAKQIRLAKQNLGHNVNQCMLQHTLAPPHIFVRI